MLRMLRSSAPVVAMLWLGSTAGAGDLLPAEYPIEEAVDHYVDAGLKEAGVSPAAAANDAELVRRLMLDLVGRIPTAAEVASFVASTDPDKRAALVDRLLASPGFVRHQANELDAMMMAGAQGSLRDYLATAVAQNRPWDRVFREVMLPDQSDPKRKGAGEFLKQRVRDLDRLANDVSTTFFGVNISCAKCHDHPRVRDWKQDHFYGMKSFLNRTYPAGNFVGERDYGTVKFLTTSGEQRQAKFMFLTGTTVDVPDTPEPSKEDQQKEKQRLRNKPKDPPPPPSFSVREKLVEVALRPGEREFFARSIVNRLWHRLYGLGLVMPLDQMHSANPPSHPELLQWLARDLAEHGYDIRRLIRGLVLTRAYARGSRWEGPGDEPPRPKLFAVAVARPLTPMQLTTSMWVAAADPSRFPADLPPEELDARILSLEQSARALAPSIAQPGEDFQVGVSEALLLSNNARVQKELLSDGGDRLIGRLKAVQGRRERIELAVRNVLSREPTAEELEILGAFLAGREDRPAQACRDLIWALMTGSEFRFNH